MKVYLHKKGANMDIYDLYNEIAAKYEQIIAIIQEIIERTKRNHYYFDKGA